MLTQEAEKMSKEEMTAKVMETNGFYIADAKIEGFCLRIDAKHYTDFAMVGYTAKDGDKLRADLGEAFANGMRTDIRAGARAGDICFNIYTELGITKRRLFCTGWQIDCGDDIARFITAFDKNRRDK